MEVELTASLPAVPFDGFHHRVWVLGRLYTEPIGLSAAFIGEEGITPNQLGALLWDALREPIVKRFLAAGLAEPVMLTGRGLKTDRNRWPYLRSRAALVSDAPYISVVVCTRDRPTQLRACLQNLEQQEYPRFEVIVVDNNPSSSAARDVVEEWAGSNIPFHYHAESRIGLSWARNTGISAANNEIVAFLDDDDQPDGYWLAGIAAGFRKSNNIGCVTGLILPARLDTIAEDLFEQIGGHRKGREFVAEVFSRSGPQSPLFPLPPFGAGANMAFRIETLKSIGGFDVALGAGTPAAACEDTLAFTLTLLADYEIAFEPSALMWHHHRREIESLRQQLHGYSVGLTAFYTALLRHRPGVLPSLLKQLPAAVRYMKQEPGGPPDILARVNRRHVQGLLTGPLAYVFSAGRQNRIAGERTSYIRKIRDTLMSWRKR